MNTTPDAQAVDAAADALFVAAVTYATALVAHAEDPQGFEAAEAALKTALSKSEEVRAAFEAALDADDIEVLDGMLDQLQQSTSHASAAVDKALTFIGESNQRIANLE